MPLNTEVCTSLNTWGSTDPLQQKQIEQVVPCKNYVRLLLTHAVVIGEKLKPDETSVSKKNTVFAAGNNNNVTWSYAIFVLLKTLIYTNVVQYKEKYCYSTS